MLWREREPQVLIQHRHTRAGRGRLSLRIREMQLPLPLQKGFVKGVGMLGNNRRCGTNRQPELLTQHSARAWANSTKRIPKK